jgi:hypothetical protein
MINYKSPTGFSVLNGIETTEYSIRFCTPLSRVKMGPRLREFSTRIDSAIREMVAKLNGDYKLKGAKV